MGYLALLYLPTIIYVEFISWKKYGSKKFNRKIVENTVFSIFAVITNISYFEKSPKSVQDCRTDGAQRSESTQNITRIIRSVNASQISCDQTSPEGSSQVQNILEDDLNFSRFQSNILYGLYCFGTAIFFCMDLGYQLVRNGEFSNTSLMFFGIFLLNIVLWVDFNFKVHQQRQPSRGGGIFEELMDVSSDLLVCVIIAPFYWLSGKIRLVIRMSNELFAAVVTLSKLSL